MGLNPAPIAAFFLVLKIHCSADLNARFRSPGSGVFRTPLPGESVEKLVHARLELAACIIANVQFWNGLAWMQVEPGTDGKNDGEGNDRTSAQLENS